MKWTWFALVIAFIFISKQHRSTETKMASLYCGSAVIYSDNGADKSRFTVIRADDDYKGQTYLCAKCKTMVAVIEKSRVVTGSVLIPIIN